MADDTETNESDNDEATQDPVSLLKSTEKHFKTNKTLMIIVLCVSGLLMTIMGTGLAVMFFEISKLQAIISAEKNPEDSQFVAVEEQLMLLADFRKSELKKIAQYTDRLTQVGIDCAIEKALPYQQLLVEREINFQQFIGSVKSGSNNLAGMSKGSKGWLKSHNEALDKLKASSINRKQSLDQMTNN